MTTAITKYYHNNYQWQDRCFNSLTIKIVALLSMIIDHIGLIMFPQIVIFRICGRLALPLYTFLIAFSFSKTKDSTLYFLKFLLMFIVIQVPTTWVLYLQLNPAISPFYMNIFANLTLGAGFIIIYQKYKFLALIYFCVIVSFLFFIQKYDIAIMTNNGLITRFNIDYGIFGFLLIPSFWMIRTIVPPITNKKQLPPLLLINIISAITLAILILGDCFLLNLIDKNSENKNTNGLIELWALLAIPFILLFREYQVKFASPIISKTIKYCFWFSYPITIALTLLIALIINI